ncbi:hypothetical protein D9613_004206 [Agrocybe pediades]|uniref:Uncharacterized protein n=1 Tax=Agrocybe pediades TaxID=84607 RepID=A0A8H4VIA8_9AGAR|nr:hypothetical protein D9613_004206 [Agrocybe pediades]
MPSQLPGPVLSDYSLRFVPFNALLMPRKTLDGSSDAQATSPTMVESPADRASILVFISAHALGSLGFAVSIFAIWFGWLLPAAFTTPGSAAASPTAKEDSAEINKPVSKPRLAARQPRQSAPNTRAKAISPAPIRRASAPVAITPILVPRPEDVPSNPRRVYFKDSILPTVVRRNTMPEPEPVCVGAVPKSGTMSVPSSANNSRSASPVRMSSGAAVEGTEGVLDSDNSPHSSKASLHMQSCLQKFKRRKPVRSDSSEKDKQAGDQASITSTETSVSVKAGKRTSGGGFAAPWVLTRNRPAPDVTVSDSASSSPSRLSFGRRKSPARPSTSPESIPTTNSSSACPDSLLSPTFLSRKSQKRVSAPIPRTSPYGAPYFATPPLLLNNNSTKNYHAYLKSLPQFEDEVQSNLSSEGEGAELSRGRTPSIRRVNLASDPKTSPRRRSASEDWTQRPNSTRS